ncbi:MAG: family 78 glycoside hydrolase catalytic domain [Bacteroidaceae bacterium]
MKLKKISLYFAFILFLIGCNTIDKVNITNLRTEYLNEPLGIELTTPRFTWEYEGKSSSFSPDKHEIHIGTNPNELIIYDPNTYLFKSHTKYYWKVFVWNKEEEKPIESNIASFETGKLNTSDWKAKWIRDQHTQDYEPAPLFRKEFDIDKEISQARLYIASAGYHLIHINGERVGDHYLDPGYTHFDKRILYVTHDITHHVKKGSNAIGVVLGNGWYNVQSLAVWDFETAYWRDRPSMIAELHVEYKDGSKDIILTDQSWKTNTGAFLYNDIYSGEFYDINKEEEGWSRSNFKDTNWQPATTINSPTNKLVAQQMPPIRVTEEIEASHFNKINDNIYVYSFPKNMSGFCKLVVKGNKGTKVRVSYGELLKENGRLEQGNINIYYHPEKEEQIIQSDVFYLKGDGKEEVYTPEFSYNGFQYVEIISDQPIELKENSLTALFVHTDLNPVGNFQCSSNLFNKIWDATMQAYRSNIHSIPTDCPQREKNGWTADAYIAIDLALLGFDGITMYEKWMNDFIDNQRDNGEISGIIPSSGWGFGEFPGPVWDAALFIIPYALYNYYGDTHCIETLYPTMEKYLEYIKTTEVNGYLTTGLGDWVFWKSTTNTEYTSTSFYYLDNKLMAFFSKLLNKEYITYQEKAEHLKSLINEKHFNPVTGIYAEGTQTAQALALYLDIVEDKYKNLVAENLHKKVAENNYFLDFGLLGSKAVPAMLAKYGYIDDVMKMALKTEAPSWGYWVETMGYTTLPETWTLDENFRDASLNHVFMGDISAWMMNFLAGINYDKNNPGFKNIILTPHFVKDLDWVKGSYHSVKGLIKSEWKRENKEIKLNVSIPLGTTATLIVNNTEKTLNSGNHQFIYKE